MNFNQINFVVERFIAVGQIHLMWPHRDKSLDYYSVKLHSLMHPEHPAGWDRIWQGRWLVLARRTRRIGVGQRAISS